MRKGELEVEGQAGSSPGCCVAQDRPSLLAGDKALEAAASEAVHTLVQRTAVAAADRAGGLGPPQWGSGRSPESSRSVVKSRAF